MSIWAHTLVRNEERYLWYSVMSVINYVDKILIWDTGSTDKTCEIIAGMKKLYPEKIDFRQFGVVDPNQFTIVRQKMLDNTHSDWIIIVDGDEVWWEDSIKSVVSEIHRSGDNLESIVTPYYNLVGDIYHYQEDKSGRYQIDGKKGYLTIRAMNRKIPGLRLEKPHGQQGFYDGKGIPVQNRAVKYRLFINKPYLHFTHLMRSASVAQDNIVIKRKFKLKHELGKKFPLDYYYPEVFFKDRPVMVPSAWQTISNSFLLRSLFEIPLRKIKKTIFKAKSGY